MDDLLPEWALKLLDKGFTVFTEGGELDQELCSV